MGCAPNPRHSFWGSGRQEKRGGLFEASVWLALRVAPVALNRFSQREPGAGTRRGHAPFRRLKRLNCGYLRQKSRSAPHNIDTRQDIDGNVLCPRFIRFFTNLDRSEGPRARAATQDHDLDRLRGLVGRGWAASKRRITTAQFGALHLWSPTYFSLAARPIPPLPRVSHPTRSDVH